MRLEAPTGTDWRTRAACTDTNTEDFFDETERATERAVAVCSSCPVRALCLDTALARGEQYGIWGGLTPDQRDRERRHRLRGRQARYTPRPEPAADQVSRAGRVGATGAVRRARALAALGYGAPTIAQASAALSRTTVSGLLTQDRSWVSTATHQGVLEAYALLAGRAPQADSASVQVRNRARAGGWAPPAAWAGADLDDPHARPRPPSASAAA